MEIMDLISMFQRWGFSSEIISRLFWRHLVTKTWFKILLIQTSLNYMDSWFRKLWFSLLIILLRLICLQVVRYSTSLMSPWKCSVYWWTKNSYLISLQFLKYSQKSRKGLRRSLCQERNQGKTTSLNFRVNSNQDDFLMKFLETNFTKDSGIDEIDTDRNFTEKNPKMRENLLNWWPKLSNFNEKLLYLRWKFEAITEYTNGSHNMLPSKPSIHF